MPSYLETTSPGELTSIRSYARTRVETVPPTLGGITLASHKLRESAAMDHGSMNNHNNLFVPGPTNSIRLTQDSNQDSTLVAFPTESTYTLACCVKTTSLRAVKKLVALSQSAQEHPMHGQTISREKMDNIIHPFNSSLSRLQETSMSSFFPVSTKNAHSSPSSSTATPSLSIMLDAIPKLYVCNASHAQHYVNFTKIKTFAIKPSGSNTPSSNFSPRTTKNAAQFQSPSKFPLSPIGKENAAMHCKINLFSPLPLSSSMIQSSSTMSPRKNGVPSIRRSAHHSKALSSKNSPSRTAIPSSVIATPNTPNTRDNDITTDQIQGNTPTNCSPKDIHQTKTMKLPTTREDASIKLNAAKFSESREAFIRLASKFWPGPLVLYLPVRCIGEDGIITAGESSPFRRSDSGFSHGSEFKARDSFGVGRSSMSSTSSCASFSNLGDPRSSISSSGSISNIISPPNNAAIPTSVFNDNNATPTNHYTQDKVAVPVLPASVLLRSSLILPKIKENCNVDNNGDNEYFVGIHCPAHPLSRKILHEVYCGPSSSISPNSRGGRPRCSIAVIGGVVSGKENTESTFIDPSLTSPSSATTTPKLATSSKQVANTMIQSPSAHTSDSNTATGLNDHIYVLDGEDTRESFSVPPCQFQCPHPTSLVIDGDDRTIYLLHNGRLSHSSFDTSAHHQESSIPFDLALTTTKTDCDVMTEHHHFPKHSIITKESIKQALLHPQQDLVGEMENASVVDRVITAVLSRWTVKEAFV